VADLNDRERERREIARVRATGERLERKVSSLTKELTTLNDQVEDTRIKLAEGVTALAVEGKFQQFTDIVSTLQSNAYGERGSVLSTTNLLLAANQLFWSLLHPFLRSAGLLSKTGGNTLTMLTPIGSLITGQLLVANRQHLRFISGVADMDANGRAMVTLRRWIAEGEWPAFQQRNDVVVTLNVLNAQNDFDAFAVVDDGVLQIRLEKRAAKEAPGQRVAWIVDTGIGNG
jgi:hypothetical protein